MWVAFWTLMDTKWTNWWLIRHYSASVIRCCQIHCGANICFTFAGVVSVYDDTFRPPSCHEQKTPVSIQTCHHDRNWSFDSANPTGCNDLLCPSASVTHESIPSDSLTHPPLCASHLVSLSVFRSLSQSQASYLHMPHWMFTLSSCSVASCSLRLTETELSGTGLPSAAFLPMCQFGPQPVGEKTWWMSECLSVCVYVCLD